MMQILIAVDQLLNTLMPPYRGDNRGWADETMSSRAWRQSGNSKLWLTLHTVVDWIALRVFGQEDHCFESWVSERLRQQMPPELRIETI
jgi:hypothetical protein